MSRQIFRRRDGLWAVRDDMGSCAVEHGPYRLWLVAMLVWLLVP